MNLKRFVKQYAAMVALPFSFLACGVEVPQNVAECDSVEVDIYPDYRNVSIPCNIAPLNFIVNTPEKDCRVCVTAPSGDLCVVEADGDGKVVFPTQTWKKILSNNLDTSLKIEVYVKNSQWSRLKPFYWKVERDSIDPLLTCRLIEPSYRAYTSLSLTSFDLEHNSYRNIAENYDLFGNKPGENQCCMNCHSQQKNGSGNSLFHYRGKNGGLVLTYNGKTSIINTKVGDLLASTTYVAWHPSLPLVAFSVNSVGQCFPSFNNAKVEIMDFSSDLVLYDIEKNEISYILKSSDKMETFPCWSGDGEKLYYVTSDSVLSHVSEYKKIKYDLACVRFDKDSMRFGTPEIVYSASSIGKSASQPKASPDGRSVVFSLSEYGCSPYRHSDCDLYELNTVTGEVRPLSEINSEMSDAYHDWSSNGKWMLFSSRCEDGNYARPFFTHCDSTGIFSKPFQIPHEDPSFDQYLLKSYNVPEFATVEPAMNPEKFYELLKSVPTSANFNGVPVQSNPVDGTSGASVIR